MRPVTVALCASPAHLESHAYASGRDTARRTPAAIRQPGHNDSTPHFPTPEESRLDHTEYGQSLGVFQDRLGDGVERRVWVLRVGEEGLEDGRGALALLWQGEARLC